MSVQREEQEVCQTLNGNSFGQSSYTDSSKILIKHIGAVHTSTPLTITQRKLSNILLKNALPNITKDKEHGFPIREIMEALEWSNKTPESLRESLRDLAKIQIQWNVLGRDKKNKWTTSAILAHVSIKDGYIYYSYSLALRELFGNPNIYAKLNLDVQRKFKDKHAVILWELVCGDLSSKKEEKISTEWIPYETILDMMDLHTDNYVKRYSTFRDRVLEPAIKEINENADILVRYEEKKLSRKISHLRFLGEKKDNSKDNTQLQSTGVEMDCILHMRQIGLTEKIIYSVLNKYTKDEIEKGIEFYNYFESTSNGTVKNPVAFFKKTLEEGWVVPPQKEPNNQELKKQMLVFEENNDEAEVAKHLRAFLKQILGENEYLSWFGKVKFSIEEGGGLCIECPNDFTKDYIASHFLGHIKDICFRINPGIKEFGLSTNNEPQILSNCA